MATTKAMKETVKDDIQIYDATYQRNGVCGIGFYVVKFTFLADMYTPPRRIPATGVVFDNGDSTTSDGYCAIITDDLKDHWRGDRFEPELRAWLRTDAAKKMIWPLTA